MNIIVFDQSRIVNVYEYFFNFYAIPYNLFIDRHSVIDLRKENPTVDLLIYGHMKTFRQQYINN